MSGPTAVNRPRHGKGTRDNSRLTEVNPYSAPVIRGHMCLVCCTRPIAAIALFTPGFRAFRMSARAKKRLCGGRPRSEDHRPITFFSPYRAAILHYPDAFRFIRLCSCRARTKSGVREPSIEWDPRRQSRPHPIDGTRAFSRLRMLTPIQPP